MKVLKVKTVFQIVLNLLQIVFNVPIFFVCKDVHN